MAEGLFRGLKSGFGQAKKTFGGARTAPVQPRETDPEEEARLLAEAQLLPPMGGALLELWRRWSDELPPKLSMTQGKSAEELHLNLEGMQRERANLSEWINRDAIARLAELERAERDGVTEVDGWCRVYLSTDRLIAWMLVFPPMGEKWRLNARMVSNALQTAGVVAGVDMGGLLRAVQELMLGFVLLPIAVGKPVVEGRDGEIIERFDRAKAKEKRARKPLDKAVEVQDIVAAFFDMMQYAEPVSAGDVLCELIPADTGVMGQRVTGEQIRPALVRKPQLKGGLHTKISEDGRFLLADCDGYLRIIDDLPEVRPVMTINGDVEYTVNNLTFDGDIHVTGDVFGDVSISATGSVLVQGVVETATVEAGGSMVVARGVVGNNQALLKCKDVFKAKYVDSSIVYAGTAVYAEYIMNSQVFSDDCVEVTLGRGVIVGGAVTAAYHIRANTVGVESERPTELILGIRPGIQSVRETIEQELQEVGRAKEELYNDLLALMTNLGMEGSNAGLAKARMRKAALDEKERKLTQQREELSAYVPDPGRCELECSMVYRGVSVQMRDSIWKTARQRGRTRISYDEKTKELRERAV